MKILLIQLSGAEDVLQSTLLLRCLKKSIPEAEVHLLVQQQHAAIIATNPFIDHLHRLHFNAHTTLHQLLPQHFDQVLDLQPSKESEPFVSQWQPPAPSQKQKGFKAFFAPLLQRTPKAKHKAEQYLQKASALNVLHDGGGLDFFIPNTAVVPFADIPASHHAGFIAIALTATSTFQWPLLLLQHFCKGIQHPLILLGTEKESPLAEKIRAIDNTKIYNACGKFSLFETADLVRKAKLLIAFQPYFIQLSAAFQKELVLLSASSSKEDLPYYSPQFLKSLKEPIYNRIILPKALLQKERILSSDKKTQQLLENSAAELKIKTNQRLKGKA